MQDSIKKAKKIISVNGLYSLKSLSVPGSILLNMQMKLKIYKLCHSLTAIRQHLFMRC